MMPHAADRTQDQLQTVTDPKLRLLLAGTKVLMDDGCHMLATGLSPEAVTSAADRTRRVFYDHFETKESFVRALLERNLQVSLGDDFGQHTHEEITALLRSAGGNLFESVRALSTLTHDRVLNSEPRAVRLVALALAGDDADLRAKIARYQHEAEQAAVRLIHSIFDFWGLQLREPWTTETFARVLVSIAEGLYLRARADPEAVPAELVLLTMLTVFPGAILPAGAPMVTVEQHVQEIADTLSTSWRESTEPGELDNAYERVLNAFRSEVQERGIERVTTASVAARSAVSPAIVVRTFGDTTGLLRAAVTEDLPALQTEVDFDLSTDLLEIEEALRRHMLRLTSWATEHGFMCLAIISKAARRPHPNPALELQSDVMSALALPAVAIFAAGIDRGIVRADMSPETLAATVTRIVISGAGTDLGFDLDQSLNATVDLLMNGCKNE